MASTDRTRRRLAGVARDCLPVFLLLLAAGAARAQAASEAPTKADTVNARDQRPTLKISGVVQMWYKTRWEANGDASKDPDFFRLQRVRLQFAGRAAPHVRYEVEVDPRAPEVGGILRDAFVSLDYVPRHELRIGQQKTMFGWENPISSTRLFTVNRTEISEGLARGFNLRDIGLGLIGSLKISDRVRFEDALTLVNGSGLNVQADSTARKNFWGRVGLRYRRGEVTVRTGVSGASGDQLFDDSTSAGVTYYHAGISRLGVDVQLEHPRLLVVAEYARGTDQAPASLPDAGGSTSGYYVLAVGKTSRELGPLVRFDVYEAFRRWTFGAYAGLPSSPVSLLLNYEIVNDDFGRHDDKIFLRLQVRF